MHQPLKVEYPNIRSLNERQSIMVFGIKEWCSYSRNDVALYNVFCNTFGPNREDKKRNDHN